MSQDRWEVRDHSAAAHRPPAPPGRRTGCPAPARQPSGRNPGDPPPLNHNTPSPAPTARPPGPAAGGAEARPHVADVEAEVRRIAAAIDALHPRTPLDAADDIRRRFEALRRQYRLDPRSVAPFASHLSILRRRLDDWLAERRDAAADRA